MFTGYIYKICCPTLDYNKIYIGQTIQAPEIRWRGHLNQAQNYTGKSKGKAAKLYEAMSILGTDNFEIVIIEKIMADSRNALINKCREREQYFTAKFDAIESGWNKVAVASSKLPEDNNTEKYMSEICDEEGVDYRAFLYQRQKKPHLTVEEIFKYLAERPSIKKYQYEYGRQIFSSITQLSKSRFNKHSLTVTQLKGRVAKASLEVKEDPTSTLPIKVLTDDILDKLSRRITYKITDPNGVNHKGSLTELVEILSKLFELPRIGTIQTRLKKPEWTPEQAFEFRYPPDLKAVEHLIEQNGYNWATPTEIFPSNTSKRIPIILHSKREVFASQKAFCETYKLSENQKEIKQKFAKGLSAEQILDHFGLQP